MRKLFLATVLAVGSVVGAPVASAQIVECQLTGVLIVVAIDGPVTICSVDTTTDDPVQLGPFQVGPNTVSPHLFAPDPVPEP